MPAECKTMLWQDWYCFTRSADQPTIEQYPGEAQGYTYNFSSETNPYTGQELVLSCKATLDVNVDQQSVRSYWKTNRKGLEGVQIAGSNEYGVTV